MCCAQVVFTPQKEGPNLLVQDAAQMHARNDPNAPQPIHQPKKEVERKPYQFLMISVLREYLALDLRVDTPFPWDVERAYDDFGELRSICRSVIGACRANNERQLFRTFA